MGVSPFACGITPTGIEQVSDGKMIAEDVDAFKTLVG
jgi:hypothetical protein